MGSSMHPIIVLYLKIKNKILNPKELVERPSRKAEDCYLPKIKNLKATQFCLQLLPRVLYKWQWESKTDVSKFVSMSPEMSLPSQVTNVYLEL